VTKVRSTDEQRSRGSAIDARGQVGLLAHCLTVALEIVGEIRPTMLQLALDRVVAERTALRVRFPDGWAYQLVDPDLAAPIVRLTPEGRTAEERWDAARKFAVADSRRPFDLRTGPLVRATLLSVGRRRHLLVLSMDQMITDAHSAHLVVDDFIRAADQFTRATGELPAVQADEYASCLSERQKQAQAGAESAMASRRRDALADATAELPWSPAAPGSGESAELTSFAVDIPDSVGSRIFELARRARVIPFAVVLAAFGLVVAEDAEDGSPRVVGSLFANRESAEERSVVGWLSRVVPVVLPTARATTADYIRAVHRELMAALSTQKVPFDMPFRPDAAGVTASVLYVPLELSGGTQTRMRIGNATIQRQAVSFCPAGADIDLYVTEGTPMLSGATRQLAIGGLATVVNEPLLQVLTRRWAAMVRSLSESEWAGGLLEDGTPR
jgi:hypothetical protein